MIAEELNPIDWKVISVFPLFIVMHILIDTIIKYTFDKDIEMYVY